MLMRGHHLWVALQQVGARHQKLQYEGEWVRGRREGHGTCYYYNGETYQGDHNHDHC